MITKAITVTREYVTLAFGTMLAGVVVFASISLAVKQPAYFFSSISILAGAAVIFYYFHKRPSRALERLYQHTHPEPPEMQKHVYLPKVQDPTLDERTSVNPKEISFTPWKVPDILPHSLSQNLWIVVEVKTNALRTALLPSLDYNLARNDSDTIVSYIRAHESHIRAYGIQHVYISFAQSDADHLLVAFRTALTRSDTLDVDLYKDMIYRVLWFTGHSSPLKITDRVAEQFGESNAINAF